MQLQVAGGAGGGVVGGSKRLQLLTRQRPGWDGSPTLHNALTSCQVQSLYARANIILPAGSSLRFLSKYFAHQGRNIHHSSNGCEAVFARQGSFLDRASEGTLSYPRD